MTTEDKQEFPSFINQDNNGGQSRNTINRRSMSGQGSDGQRSPRAGQEPTENPTEDFLSFEADSDPGDDRHLWCQKNPTTVDQDEPIQNPEELPEDSGDNDNAQQSSSNGQPSTINTNPVSRTNTKESKDSNSNTNNTQQSADQ